MSIIHFSKLKASAIIPTTATAAAAGFDLYSSDTISVEPLKSVVVDTGISAIFPKGTYGRIADKSGRVLTTCLVVCGGVIDPDYIGPLKVLLRNLSTCCFYITAGDCIAQLICEKFEKPVIQEISPPTFIKTERGIAGLGSGIGYRKL